jgi:4-hydroxy-L-threonine phosphate dehydrogenase PdxA
MKNNPIIVVTGEPRSIFLEIFFKAIKKKKYKSPLILICNKNILKNYMKKINFTEKLRILKLENLNKFKLDNHFINLIDVKLDKNNLNAYLNKSFKIAFKLIKNKISFKLINGPIIKKTFLKNKFLGVTEYISHEFKISNTGMLIFNRKLSVVPITTHLPLKLVSNQISKRLLKDKINLVHNFYKKYFKFNPKIAVTGLNPHCESILSYNEDIRIIEPTIKLIKKKQY